MKTSRTPASDSRPWYEYRLNPTANHANKRQNTPVPARRGAWREAAGLLAAVLGLFLIDAALFRTRLYYPVLEPNATAGAQLFNSWQIGLILLSLMLAQAEEKSKWFERLVQGPIWAYAAALTLGLVCLELFGVIEVQVPFVYFQF